jgi:hypothetical protein
MHYYLNHSITIRKNLFICIITQNIKDKMVSGKVIKVYSILFNRFYDNYYLFLLLRFFNIDFL